MSLGPHAASITVGTNRLIQSSCDNTRPEPDPHPVPVPDPVAVPVPVPDPVADPDPDPALPFDPELHAPTIASEPSNAINRMNNAYHAADGDQHRAPRWLW